MDEDEAVGMTVETETTVDAIRVDSVDLGMAGKPKRIEIGAEVFRADGSIDHDQSSIDVYVLNLSTDEYELENA